MMSKLLFQSSTVYLSLSPGVLSIVVLAVNLPFPTFVSSFRVTEVIEGFVYFRFLSLRPLFRLFDKFETCFSLFRLFILPVCVYEYRCIFEIRLRLISLQGDIICFRFALSPFYSMDDEHAEMC